jgi:hypothetical protein
MSDFEEQTLFVQEGGRRSVDFALNFAQAKNPTRPFACRLTGGCANMSAADAVGLRRLERALCGGKTDKRFAGFALFGGTRMLSTIDPTEVLPGITEVFPNIAEQCPNMEMLGLIAGFRRQIRSSDPKLAGQIIIDKSKNFLTVVHPRPRSILQLQPLPDNEEVWDDEYKETARCFQALHEYGWQTLNIVFNGGTVTEREIKLWANLGLQNPGLWNMLLIKDSGRIAEQFAEDADFLACHQNIVVAENDIDDMVAKLSDLGALVDGQVFSKILPFRRTA